MIGRVEAENTEKQEVKCGIVATVTDKVLEYARQIFQQLLSLPGQVVCTARSHLRQIVSTPITYCSFLLVNNVRGRISAMASERLTSMLKEMAKTSLISITALTGAQVFMVFLGTGMVILCIQGVVYYLSETDPEVVAILKEREEADKRPNIDYSGDPI